MPVPKRWFHCSRDLNHDPELWAFTDQFGDRALRLWLEILAILERSENQWRLAGNWKSVLARLVRLSPSTIQRALDWMLANGWLTIRQPLANHWPTIGQPLAEDSPTILSAPNYWKYHKTPGAHRELIQVPSYPNLSFPSSEEEKKKKEKKGSAEGKSDARSRRLSDEEFLALLRTNPAYSHLNLDMELGKMEAWLATRPGRQKTRKFIVNWLNKIDKPVVAAGAVEARKPLPPPFPPANDPIARNLWRKQYGQPEQYGY